jgi:hypothetical protein
MRNAWYGYALCPFYVIVGIAPLACHTDLFFCAFFLVYFDIIIVSVCVAIRFDILVRGCISISGGDLFLLVGYGTGSI